MRGVTKAHWRALVHGLALGQLRYAARGHLRGADLVHLREQNPWMTQRNVVGICIARKRRRGRLEAVCLQVLVREKRPESKLDRKFLIPRRIDPRPVLAARWLDTDVREVGALSLDTLISGARPTQPGFAIGGRRSGSGTIGCIAFDSVGRALGLSCAHVVADSGRAAPGSPVLVPSAAQARILGVAEPEFGTLVATGSIGFSDAAAFTNLDAATFLPDDPSSLVPEVALWGRRPLEIAANVSEGTRVFKVGAATETTLGIVVARHAMVRVPYRVGTTERFATFLDQIGISSFTDFGDSGSLVLTEDGKAVGLHFASSNGMSICTPIQTVLTGLGVTLTP